MHKMQYELDQLRREEMLRKASQRQNARQEKATRRADSMHDNTHETRTVPGSTALRETSTSFAV
ncbi:MAG: hypothetical protein OHK0046_40300 [Anaerolineae bacterium]